MSKGSGTTGDPGRIGAQLDRDDNIDNKPWSELRHEATDKFNEVLKAFSAPADPARDVSVSSVGMTQGRDVGASEMRSGAPPPAGKASGGDSVGAINRAITRPAPMESGREAGADAKKGGSNGGSGK